MQARRSWSTISVRAREQAHFKCAPKNLELSDHCCWHWRYVFDWTRVQREQHRGFLGEGDRTISWGIVEAGLHSQATGDVPPTTTLDPKQYLKEIASSLERMAWVRAWLFSPQNCVKASCIARSSLYVPVRKNTIITSGTPARNIEGSYDPSTNWELDTCQTPGSHECARTCFIFLNVGKTTLQQHQTLIKVHYKNIHKTYH